MTCPPAYIFALTALLAYAFSHGATTSYATVFTLVDVDNTSGLTVPSGDALYIQGTYTGSGDIDLPQSNISSGSTIETLKDLGLHFNNNQTSIVTGAITPVSPSLEQILGAKGAGTVLVYDGIWNKTGSNNPYLALQEGGKIVLGPNAQLKHQAADLISARSMLVRGDGASQGNVFEVDPGFQADRSSNPLPSFPPPAPSTANGVPPESLEGGWSALHLTGVTFVSHHSQSLPMVWKNHSYGGQNFHGLIRFNKSNDTVWRVETNDQFFNGQLKFEADATLDLQTDLNFTGLMSDKSETSLRVDSGVSFADFAPTITKEGPARLNIWGDQGYALPNGRNPVMQTLQGEINFMTDPGAGFHSFGSNYNRNSNGEISFVLPDQNLSTRAEGSTAVLNFATQSAHVHRVELLEGGSANIKTITGGFVGSKSLRTRELQVVQGQGLMTIEEGGVTEVEQLFAIDAAASLLFLGSGELEITSGANQMYGTGASIEASGGTLRINSSSGTGDGQFNLSEQALLTGGGRLFVHLDNDGIVAPGETTGSLSVARNYTQSGRLQIEIAGNAPGTQYDLLSIDGSATLGGVIQVDLLNDFVPTLGSVFQVLTTSSGAVSGQFDKSELPIFGGHTFGITYHANQVLLTVIESSIAGDYNQNGVVDAADYTLWRDSFGQAGPNLAADGDGDGSIDADDYDVWVTNFGTTASSSSQSIPEPATWSLSALSLAIIAVSRRQTGQIAG